MKKVKILGMSLVVASVLGVGLTGCGGGSGGGSGGLAEANIKNGKEVADKSATKQKQGKTSRSNDNDTSNINPLLLNGKISTKMVEYFKNKDLNEYSLNEAINENETCLNGGTYSLDATFYEVSSTLAGTLTFNDCNEGGEITDGKTYITMSDIEMITEEEIKFKDASMKFLSNYTITTNSDEATIHKDSSMDISYISYPSQYKIIITAQYTDGKGTYKIENGVYHYTENSYTNEVYQTEGKTYLNDGSYVEYDEDYDMSKTPLVFEKGSDIPFEGESRCNMAGDAKLKIKVEGKNNPVVSIDKDGDGNFERTEDNEKGDETTPPKPTEFEKKMSQKKYVEIIRNTQPSICSLTPRHLNNNFLKGTPQQSKQQ